MAQCKCSDIKYKSRSEIELRDLTTRLSKIEGQVRGIKKMVEDERYCIDILTQVSAVSAAINSFNKVLLNQHIKTCVVNDIREGNDEAVNELIDILKKIMK